MNVFDRILGMVEVSVTSADPARMIGIVVENGILIQNVCLGEDPFLGC